MSSLSHLKAQAIELRKQGFSYGAILKKLQLKSKGTLSAWFKHIELSAESKELLLSNITKAKEHGLHLANQKRSQKIQQENDDAFNYGFSLAQNTSNNELAHIGASLYWGEGTKSEKYQNNIRLVFTNSDGRMVGVFMRFVRDILKVPNEKIGGGIHLYPDTNVSNAREYWANITNIPEEKFYIVSQVSRASNNKRPFNILPYGTVVIKIQGRKYFYIVKGMIHNIISRYVK